MKLNVAEKAEAVAEKAKHAVEDATDTAAKVATDAKTAVKNIAASLHKDEAGQGLRRPRTKRQARGLSESHIRSTLKGFRFAGVPSIVWPLVTGGFLR